MDANELAKVAQVNLMIDFLTAQRRALLAQAASYERLIKEWQQALPLEAQPKPGQDVVTYRDRRG